MAHLRVGDLFYLNGELCAVSRDPYEHPHHNRMHFDYVTHNRSRQYLAETAVFAHWKLKLVPAVDCQSIGPLVGSGWSRRCFLGLRGHPRRDCIVMACKICEDRIYVLVEEWVCGFRECRLLENGQFRRTYVQ